jgi:threonine/homoserine/homoserine lactone efflux protein
LVSSASSVSLVSSAVAPDSRADAAEARAPRAPVLALYRQATLANVLNPKAASVFFTLVPQFLDPARPVAAQILTFAAAQCVLVAAWLFGWSFPIARAARRSRSAAAGRLWARVSGVVLVGLGVRSAVA